MVLEILVAYTYILIIGSIVGLGNVSSEEPGHTLPVVSGSVPADGLQSKVGGRSAEDMEVGDAEPEGAFQADPNRDLSNQTAKEEASSLTPGPDRIHDIFQEEGATQSESDFEKWAK